MHAALHEKQENDGGKQEPGAEGKLSPERLRFPGENHGDIVLLKCAARSLRSCLSDAADGRFSKLLLVRRPQTKPSMIPPPSTRSPS